jgi:hypothetical protein
VFVVDYTPPKTPNIVEPDHQNCIVHLMPSVSGGHKFFSDDDEVWNTLCMYLDHNMHCNLPISYG